MPYKTMWYKPDRVAYLELLGEFSLEEMVESSEAIRDQYLEVGTSPVHLVCDLRGLSGHSRDLRAARRAAEIYLNHPSMGWVIVIGMDSPIVKFLLSIISQMTQTDVKTVQSLEEVDMVLRRIDGSLAQT